MDLGNTKQTNVPRGSYREVINVAWPIVVSMLSYTFMGVADTFLVASLGITEVAAVGLGSVAGFTLVSFGWGIMNGVKVVVAQAHGAERAERTISATRQGLLLAVVAGLIILCCLPLGRAILYFMGGRGEVLTLSSGYFGVRLWGVLPMYLSIAAFGYFQGLGDTKTPMRVQVAANVLNIGLDLILIFGWGPIRPMGVEGAALATVIAFSLQGIVAVVLFRRASRGQGRFSIAGLKELWQLGLPMGTRFMLEVMSWAVFTGFVARMGEIHLAAHTITIRVISVSFLPGHGIGEATCVLTGQAVGAKDESAARRVTRCATVICLATMGFCGLLFLFWGTQIVSLFSDDIPVLELGAQLMLIAAAFQLMDGVAMVKTGALNGAGDTRFVMWISVGAAWAVLLPLGYVLCNQVGMGAPGAWIALTTQILVLSFVMTLRWEGRHAIASGVRRAARAR